MSPEKQALAQWLEEHPRLPWVVTIGLAVIILELSALLKLGVELLARCAR
jgi:hypothetical protein